MDTSPRPASIEIDGVKGPIFQGSPKAVTPFEWH